MSYTLNKTGVQIDAILNRATAGGQLDLDIAAEAAARAAADALKAPLASPALTGTPTAPTAAPGTDTTQLATTAFANAAAAAAAALAASGKADLVAGATAGNLAGLDGSGNLTDAGIAAADVATKDDVQNITPKRTAQNDPANSSFSVLCDTAIAGQAKPKLYGKSAVINQLANHGNFDDISGLSNYGVSISASNNVLTMTALSAIGSASGIAFPATVQSGRKYYIAVTANFSKASSYAFLLGAWSGNTGISTGSTRIEYIGAAGADGTAVRFGINRGGALSEGDTVTAQNFNIIDLTAIFTAAELAGIGTSPASLKTAWLKKYGYPLPQYIPYNAGSIVNNNATYLMHGRNIWDEEWESGTINSATGQNEANAGLFRSKNYIPVRGSVCVYYGSYSSSNPYTTLVLYQYDANKQYIAVTAIALSGKASVYTLNEQTAFVRFRSGGTTAQASYQGDICFNVPDTSFNGQYEAYYNGGSVTADSLNGIGTAMDEQDAEGQIVRKIGSVMFGSLGWTKIVNGDKWVFQTTVPGRAASKNVLCAIYVNDKVTTSAWNLAQKSYNASAAANDTRIYLMDMSYLTADELKTATASLPLYYELATPTTDSTSAASIQTQSGYNCFEPVSGDVQSADASVEYAVDVIAYIDKKIAEL